jgi:diguanylate cyclase (GGDEF)-like protein
MSQQTRLLLDSIFETMEEGVSVFDADLRLRTANRRFRELLGFDESLCVAGTPFAAFVRAAAERGEYGSGDIEELVASRVALALRFEPHNFERAQPDGRILEVRGRPLPGGGFMTMYADITERKVAQRRIRDLATRDALTGLPNRAWFSELLNVAIHTARRYGRQLALLFIDLDRFKIINDTMGHEAGDTLVRKIAKQLEGALRSSDVVARLGGDEFVVLLQDLQGTEQAATVARKLLAAVIQPVTVRNTQCRVTASIGICIFPDDAQDEQTLMRHADIAMYLAKEDGKNTYQFYSRADKTQLFERMNMETHLRTALARSEFSLHYQAKVDLKTNRITGVEALLRWQSPELGMVSPVLFIPVAEQAGLLVAIGRWVLKTACEQNVEWQRLGFAPTCVAVNLSACQFTQDGLLSDIADAIESSGMDPRLLELEITEGMMIHDVGCAVKQLSAIKQMGVRIAIDDFGTGYSSLAQLKRFPIDCLKVDRSFIRDIHTDAADRAIVEAIIAIAKTLSLTVVAEGVETIEQQQFLRDHGCDEMQGFLFSRPVSADVFLTQWGNSANRIS